MQQIASLLEKIQALYSREHEKTAVDVDLMLDYARQLYAALLDWRATVPAETQTQVPAPAAVTQTEEIPAAAQAAPEPAQPAAAASRPDDAVAAAPTAQETSTPLQRTPAKAASAKDIRKLIGINDKYRIISELFLHDGEAYEAAIRAINDSADDTEALGWLHAHVSWNYNWSEEHDTVQLFYELIGRFFAQQDQ